MSHFQHWLDHFQFCPIWTHQTNPYIWPCHVDICSVCVCVCVCVCVFYVSREAVMIYCSMYWIYHVVNTNEARACTHRHTRTHTHTHTQREHVRLIMNHCGSHSLRWSFQKQAFVSVVWIFRPNCPCCSTTFTLHTTKQQQRTNTEELMFVWWCEEARHHGRCSTSTRRESGASRLHRGGHVSKLYSHSSSTRHKELTG